MYRNRLVPLRGSGCCGWVCGAAGTYCAIGGLGIGSWQSGALYRNVVRKRAKRLLLPWAFWCLVYLAWRVVSAVVLGQAALRGSSFKHGCWRLAPPYISGICHLPL